MNVVQNAVGSTQEEHGWPGIEPVSFTCLEPVSFTCIEPAVIQLHLLLSRLHFFIQFFPLRSESQQGNALGVLNLSPSRPYPPNETNY